MISCESPSMTDLRAAQRVILSNAIAFLRLPTNPQLPSLPCVVENLSSGGCRCIALLERISAASAETWVKTLDSRPSVVLDLLSVPLISVRVPAIVRYVADSAHCAIGLQFHNLSTQEHAMLTCALDRLNGSLSEGCVIAEKSFTPAQLAGKRVTRILASMGTLPESAAEEAEKAALTSRKSVAHYLLRRGLVTSHDYTRAMALHAALPTADLTGFEFNDELRAILPLATLLQHRMIPIDRAGSVVCVAVSKSLSSSSIRTLEKRFSISLYVFLAPEEQVNALLRQIDPQPRQRPRDFQRRDVSVPVEFTFANSGEVTFNGQTLDVCEGGFGLECSDDLSLCGVCIRFKLNTPEGVVAGLGSIRFVRKDDGQDRWIAGVEILELTQEDWDRLTAFCASRSSE